MNNRTKKTIRLLAKCSTHTQVFSPDFRSYERETYGKHKIDEQYIYGHIDGMGRIIHIVCGVPDETTPLYIHTDTHTHQLCQFTKAERINSQMGVVVQRQARRDNVCAVTGEAHTHTRIYT